jgi:hypothetical protein
MGRWGDGEVGRSEDSRLFDIQAQFPIFAFPKPLPASKIGFFNNPDLLGRNYRLKPL